MSWPGGKSGAGVYQRLINEIPPHFVYVEACLGGGAIMCNIAPALLSIGCDPDLDALGVVASSCSHKNDTLKLIKGCGLDFLESAFQLERRPGCQPGGGVFRWGGFAVPAERVFVYFDPPYPMETRRGGRLYKFEWGGLDHKRLLQLLPRLRCNVMVSSYPNSHYREALQDWRTFTFDAATRGGVRTEQVWMNYGPPSALHDYRYLGGDRREREKLRRRTRNLSAKLQALPAVERHALFAELVDAVFPDDVDGERRLFELVGARGFGSAATLEAAAVDRDWPACAYCAADLLIGESGLVCRNGCGKVLPVSTFWTADEFERLSDVQAAFPEKVVG